MSQPIALLLIVLVSGDLYRRLDKASMTERFGKAFERAGNIAGQLRLDWDLGTWVEAESRPDLITLSLYINACTAPTDRVLVQSYLPQVLALARRAFAGGHADLRPGFFETEDAQRLTLERLRAPIGADHPARYRGLAPQLLPVVPDHHGLYRSGVSSGRHAHLRRAIRPHPVRAEGSNADRCVGSTGLALLRTGRNAERATVCLEAPPELMRLASSRPS